MFGLHWSDAGKKRFEWVLILAIVASLAFYLLHVMKQPDWQSAFQWDALHQWMQDNMGTFVFGLVCAGLILFFLISLSLEWNAPFLKSVYEWFDPFMLAGAIALILITYFARTYYIPSESMEPTLLVHDYIVVAKPFVLKLFGDYPPHRGDIIVFHPPLPGETREYIKRVIGLPGETFAVHDGSVFIDGKPLHEPYIASPPDYVFGPIKIPDQKYIVLGDNRTNSEDSHAWPDAGATPFLSLQRIEGRAVFIFFPPRRIRFLHGYRFYQQAQAP